jgi:membrane associated rhomboid family serine protease
MSELEKPHRGVNYSRLPAAGLPGLMLALGVVWMFWWGAPSYRPIAVAAAIVGGISGVLLIVWRARKNRRPDSELLHLRDRE